MKAVHIEFLVEEPSMEAFLQGLLPRVLDNRVTFMIYPSQCKHELLRRLPDRLRGYASWLPENWRIIVVVDRDDDDCLALKRQLEGIVGRAGLQSRRTAGPESWQVVSRMAIEELEAWYFGDWEAVREAYPGVSAHVPHQAGYRDPDAIRGGTWEAFQRVLHRAGYFQTGLRKIEAARCLGRLLDPKRNRSRSFGALRDVLMEVMA